MSIEITTEQGFSMTYHYGVNELRQLKGLITNGGEKVINSDYLQSSTGYLRHFKNAQFEGPYYAMPLEGVLESINEILNKI